MGTDRIDKDKQRDYCKQREGNLRKEMGIEADEHRPPVRIPWMPIDRLPPALEWEPDE